jgi:hypothetical protein
MPMSSTVIRINKSASNSSKYAANKSLTRRYILLYFSKKALRGGAQDLQGLTPQKSVARGAHKIYKIYKIYTV